MDPHASLRLTKHAPAARVQRFLVRAFKRTSGLERHEGGSFVTGQHGETLIELRDVLLTQKAVGLFQGPFLKRTSCANSIGHIMC